jgi:hypothetical protein
MDWVFLKEAETKQGLDLVEYRRKQIVKELKDVARLANAASGETDNLPWVAVRMAAMLDTLNMVGYHLNSKVLDRAIKDLAIIPTKIRSATKNGKVL